MMNEIVLEYWMLGYMGKESVRMAKRLLASDADLLRLLINHDQLYGLEMVEKSGGKFKRGTIYITLNRLEDEGLVVSEEVPVPKGEIGSVRRVYRITPNGRSALES